MIFDLIVKPVKEKDLKESRGEERESLLGSREESSAHLWRNDQTDHGSSSSC